MTGTVDGKTEELIKRSLFVFANEDRELRRQVLQYLRGRRHGFVHSAEQSANADVERMLLFHLRKTGEFSNRRDAVEFLGLPFQPELLRKRIKQLRSALRYSTGKS